VGAGIGVLIWASFFYSDKPIACSTIFAKASGMIERLFRGLKERDKLITKKWIKH